MTRRGGREATERSGTEEDEDGATETPLGT